MSACLKLLLISVMSLGATAALLDGPTGTPDVVITVIDADSGKPLANVPVEVELFSPEHGARKFLPRGCEPLEGAPSLFTFAPTTDVSGSFSLNAPCGDYPVRITVPQRQPVFGCVHVDTEESVSACGASLGKQRIFVRTISSVPGFSGDILASSAC